MQLSYVDRMLAMDDESRETRKQLHSIKQQVALHVITIQFIHVSSFVYPLYSILVLGEEKDQLVRSLIVRNQTVIEAIAKANRTRKRLSQHLVSLQLVLHVIQPVRRKIVI